MKTSTKIILAAAFVSTLVLGGKLPTVYGQKPQSPVRVMPQVSQSIQVAEASDGDGETNDDANEQKESVKLQSLAKITPQQAQQAVETTQQGKARRVKLENENGNLVYAVEIGQQEVKVDAGNGRVLYTENVNQEDKNEATRPKSSIQVPQTRGGERETDARGAK